MINKLKRGAKKLKWIGNEQLFNAGLKKLNPLNRTGRRIIIYHGVVNNVPLKINSRFISSKVFEEQIKYFTTHFHIVSLDDYFQGASHPNKLTIALTFDDGYLNNLNIVLPILEKYKAFGTFFITTIGVSDYNILWADALDLHRFTGSNKFIFDNETYYNSRIGYKSKKEVLKQLMVNSNWHLKKKLIDTILSKNAFIDSKLLMPYYQLLDNEGIKRLSSSDYAEIGTHGVYHNCLSEIPFDDAKDEMLQSKEYLENLVQKEVNSIAYPNGLYTKELVNEADNIGYKQQLAVEYLYDEDKSDERIESRFGINPYISVQNQIQCIIDGKY